MLVHRRGVDMSKRFRDYFKLQMGLVGGLYMLACALQMLTLLPVSFMPVAVLCLSGVILLIAHM